MGLATSNTSLAPVFLVNCRPRLKCVFSIWRALAKDAYCPALGQPSSRANWTG